MDNLRCGLLRGTGAAINVEIGWIPDYVVVTNLTDGDKITTGFPLYRIFAFTSGGTTEIGRSGTLKGVTSGASAHILGVIHDSGTWAGGDAAGWIIIDASSKIGTFTGEAAYVTGNSGGSLDQATLTAVDANLSVSIDTEAASETGNAGITAYVGSASSNSRGFTLGSTISEDAKLLHFMACRSGPGGQGRPVLNSLTLANNQ